MSFAERPIAVNALALNPGVTVTVSACLLRTREGLARWQLRTFEAFYQSYLQQLAAWESQFYSDAPKGLTRSPGLMRRDERVALKERVIWYMLPIPDASSFFISSSGEVARKKPLSTWKASM